MRRVIFHVFVALLAFGLGVLADSAWASLFATSAADEQIPPVLIQRDNELHRPYRNCGHYR